MIKYCPITYLPLEKNQKYSPAGLKLLSPKLTQLNDLPFNTQQLQQEALAYADKLSIQGVQYKLSAALDIKNAIFKLVERQGKYILKPQSPFYENLPENEDLSMRLAKTVKIETPLHGLIYNKDQALVYFIKRFDRKGHTQKIPVEDFAQLSNHTRDTKYQFSMERLIPLIEKYCTFPAIEKEKLFRRVLFNFIIGNEDMHLKNFSLITREKITQLAPAYDFLNSTIAIKNAKEEIALPLNGKKSNLTSKDLVNYYGKEKLELPSRVIDETLVLFKLQYPEWPKLIKNSFLPEHLKEKYNSIIKNRTDRIF